MALRIIIVSVVTGTIWHIELTAAISNGPIIRKIAKLLVILKLQR